MSDREEAGTDADWDLESRGPTRIVATTVPGQGIGVCDDVLMRLDLAGPDPRLLAWRRLPYPVLGLEAVPGREGVIVIKGQGGDAWKPPRFAGRELRSGADLGEVELLPVDAGVLSPDGRWEARVDTSDHGVILVDRTGALAPTRLSTGASRVHGVHIGPQHVAVFCGHGPPLIRLVTLTAPSGPAQEHVVPRPKHPSPNTWSHATFSEDGRQLVFFETDAIGYDDGGGPYISEEMPSGWIGDVVLIDVARGVELWSWSYDAEVAGDHDRIEVAYPDGFETEVRLVSDRVVCGGPGGQIVSLDRASGQLVEVLDVDTNGTDVTGLFLGHDGRLWALSRAAPRVVDLSVNPSGR